LKKHQNTFAYLSPHFINLRRMEKYHAKKLEGIGDLEKKQ